ncbi:extracellular solute-binding protein [Limimaricola hongkongensis]|uniref:Oligopeptide ABC transporter, periplasmic oligopeptide-binding protein OppA n=1 Tax=Limimaricola hongkongensis DSM 17492 TaxID=1122180 RepID=A0A017HE20_9RHOB|nr:extracellular solute-binding protein [Limimaricola hongkongensis]EYD72596.1 Oligopeptide ABC transporter, periplasmic oligopeptide-binding protein OppA [Limimaricola hongkongensis DSM 17492]
MGEARLWITGSALALGALLLAPPATAQEAEATTTSHGFANFGELKYPADFAHLDYVNPDAPKGGEISQWAMGTFDSFNSFARQGVSAALNTLPLESIMTSTADDPYGLYCYLCSTITYPESLDWLILDLRDDVTFSDGTPMTAEDVKFSAELFLEQGITEYRTRVGSLIDEIEVLGPHEVKFSFAPEAPRRDVVGLAGGTVVFSKAWFEETGARLDESRDAPFMGTGPYLLESADINRRVVYGRNENFWGADIPFNVGRNNFDTIRIEYFADSAAAFEGFKSGEYTFRAENSSKDWATGYDFPAAQKGWVVTEEIPDGNIGTGQAFVFNLDDPTWQDPRVREAIGLMFNFEWSNESLFYGLYERVESFWENSDLEAVGTPSEAERDLLAPLVEEGLLPESILTDEARRAPVLDAGANGPDRATYRRAGKLLEEAGWSVGDDGLRRKDGAVLELVFLQRSPQFDRIVNPFIENLARLGVRGVLERVDTSQYVERTRSGDFDLVNHSFTMGFEPGGELEQWFASKTADDSSRNLMRLRSTAVDRLIQEVLDAGALDELTTATHALDRVLRAEMIWVPQWYKDVHTVAYYDQFRHPDPIPPFARGELDFWWYDAEAAQDLRAAGALR